MKNTNKRILIWAASYPPVLGGLQTVTHQLAHGLAERGHQVMVLTNRHPYSLAAQEQQGLVSVERIKHYRATTSLHSLTDMGRYLRSRLCFPTSQRLIVSLINNFQPDIINIHFPDPQLPYWASVQPYFKGRLVISLHGHEVLRWFQRQQDGILSSELRPTISKEKIAKNRLTKILEEGEVVTACSNWLLQKANQLFNGEKNNQFITHNAIDSQRFISRKKLGKQSGFIFSAGRLDEHKGFDLLILAIAKIKPEFPLIKVEIAGDGQAHQTLKSIIKDYKLEDNVSLIGRLSQDQLSEKLTECKMVVIPSRRETFGISVLEGIASGKPVVATNVGGIPEAAGELATLVPPTVEGIAQGIRLVLQKKQIPLANSVAIEAHLAQFTLQRFIDQYEVALVGND